MAEFINYIIDSPIQPVKTNVLWVKKGVLHYYNKKWIPIAGNGSGNVISPIISGEGNNSAILAYSDNKALNVSSVALGYNTNSNNFAEASFGKYNLSYESDNPSIATLFSIGNGTEEERKNAFEVKEDGTFYINGNIYIKDRIESLQDIINRLENYYSDSGGEGEDSGTTGIDEEQLKDYLDENKYVTEDYVNQKIEEISTGVDKHYVHKQNEAAKEWKIKHDLNKFPSVTIVDTSETIVYGDVIYESTSEIKVTFTAAFGGKAYLN